MEASIKAVLASDSELMGRVQADDDTEAFAALHDRHATRAFRVALAICRSPSNAEDAVQEGFLSVWRSRASYSAGRGSFKGWLIRVVQNRAIDATRRDAASHRPELCDLDVDLFDPEAVSVPDQVVAGNEVQTLRTVLGQIPPAQAEVITLAFFGELSHSEIARHLSLPAGTVKGRMRLGLEKLRQRIEAHA